MYIFEHGSHIKLVKSVALLKEGIKMITSTFIYYTLSYLSFQEFIFKNRIHCLKYLITNVK